MKTYLYRYTNLLERTPSVLYSIFKNLSEETILSHEGENTWTVKQVLIHIVLEERYNWVYKLLKVIDFTVDLTFLNLKEDRLEERDIESYNALSIEELLKEFELLRNKNLKVIHSIVIDNGVMKLEGEHPKFGRYSIKELMSIWTAHDWVHITQISRTIAKLFKEEVGPWKENIRLFR